MSYEFDGKIALITGAASGIGRATAIAFASDGARIMLSDTNEQGLLETTDKISADGGECRHFLTNVADEAAVSELISNTVETFGGLDFAFNNAGVSGVMAKTAEQTRDDWQHVIDVNLTGVYLCMKYELQAMLKQGSGVIVNTASVAGLVGMNGAPAYCAAKHGVIGLTKNAALEYAKLNIRVNAVCPGGVRTNMTETADKMIPGFLDKLAKHEPMGRLAEPEEIASAVTWLCSPGATFMTGHALAVDGGFVAR